MQIGIDFDNTIVSYDRLFHRVGVETGLIPAHLSATKVSVRNYLRSVDCEDDWTEMQGHVYGIRMGEAEVFPGVIEFLRRARDEHLEVRIVSHKTRYPFRGQQHDLHRAAREWIGLTLSDATGPLVPPDQVFFEVTKDDKLWRITNLQCDYFVDDLPEILLAPQFPNRTRRILFDPDGVHPRNSALVAHATWYDIGQHIAAHVA